jgi:hypothetical protein
LSQLVQTALVGNNVDNSRQDNDFYATPPYIINWLITNEDFGGSILEPSCGDARISKMLNAWGYDNITSRDLFDYGFGETGIDFLSSTEEFDNIITNPPFEHSLAFMKHAIKLYNKKLALLLPIRYLTGQARCKFYEKNQPKKILVIPNKVDFDGSCNPTMEFAWYIWEKGFSGDTTIKWLPWTSNKRSLQTPFALKKFISQYNNRR